ncbi:MAG: DUF2911 domain-containing protein [Terriglobales bacterium]
MRGRQIFGPGGLLSHDPNYPVWRAGANAATAFHTDADLMLGDLHVRIDGRGAERPHGARPA